MFRCPECNSKFEKIPVTGVCVNCNKFSFRWIDTNLDARLVKIKLNGARFFAFMFVLLGLIFLGNDYPGPDGSHAKSIIAIGLNFLINVISLFGIPHPAANGCFAIAVFFILYSIYLGKKYDRNG